MPTETPVFASAPRLAGVVVWVQCAMLIALLAGSLGRIEALEILAAVLAVIAALIQWRQLLPLARLFFGLAVLSGGGIALLRPEFAPQILRALVQGVGFSALMMVLGLLRQPVRRAPITRDAAEYLLSFRPRARYAALLSGAHFMSLMFNVGIIAMIGDLVQPREAGRDPFDPARRAMVVAAMRGCALVTMWSPIGLGFAIVVAGLPALNALSLMGVALIFTAAVLAVVCLFPMLPAAATPDPAKPGFGPRGGSLRAVVATGLVSLLLLVLAIGLHRLLGISFTLVSVGLLPIFSFIWLAIEDRGQHGALGGRVIGALRGMADLRSEAAIFLSANVLGAALSVLVQLSPLWALMHSGAFAGLPVLLAALVVIPLVAAAYLPNSVVVVMAAQLLGPMPLGMSHPLALGLTLSVGWSLAIAVSPISAMSLVTAKFCGVTPRLVAYRWNVAFVTVTGLMAAVAVSLVYWLEG